VPRTLANFSGDILQRERNEADSVQAEFNSWNINDSRAIPAVQVLPPGVYIAMNGRLYDPHRVRKDREQNRFAEGEEAG